ncbi:hypothetical protein MTX20_20550 [Bradyrhizobium sp. ISRA435]|nr:hypothetical protein MTX20_20550 [Bradyrhizobium sp. ISRA435]
MAVDAIGLRDLHLAGQLFARDEAAVSDAALDAVGDLPPQGDAGTFLHAHGAVIPEIFSLSRNSHGACYQVVY